ncbi:type VI secretion system-associated FHA domain protein [Xenorhabdus lircayensis]|nr:type VI secretion system-associated FHA domain protein [Xenorhabdus lircayensis]
MRFTIVKNIGTNQPPQLSCDFSPPGGTIGRSTDNNWVLPDEDQAIARSQAIVSISADGECRITNRGAASEILLNTIPMAPDRQIEVRDGDVLNIGDYQIQVINIDQSVPPSATTRVLNTTQTPTSKPEEIPSAVWEGLENIFTAPDVTSTSTTSTQKNQQISQELHDNNPLIKPQQHQERNPINPLEQMETTIDLDTLQFRATDPITMFTSDTDFQQENILNDSTPSTLLQQNNQYGNRSDKWEVDPLALFSDKHAQSLKNDDPLNLMLNNAEPLVAPDEAAISELQERPGQDNSLYFTQESSSPLPSLFATEETTRSSTDPVKHQYSASNPPFRNKNNGNRAYERLDIDPITIKYTPNSHPTEGVKLEGKLLAALLDGMGLNHIQRPQFDEHAMYQLGKLLSQLSQGIMALNASRTLLKHEADTDMTQILVDANNPFKLLPSGQAVLVQMFGNQMPGFMSPEQATRDILIELQAHQLGMIAGLRTIATDILQSFEPTIIEQKAREEGGLPRLSLSSTYKASLWDYLIQSYQKTVNKPEQSYPLFGENFWQTYEAEINQYKDSQNKSKK